MGKRNIDDVISNSENYGSNVLGPSERVRSSAGQGYYLREVCEFKHTQWTVQANTDFH
jgi:hypothetical protein